VVGARFALVGKSVFRDGGTAVKHVQGIEPEF
jgi:hypothetical protein